MHLVGIAQSFGLFLFVCLATAAALSLAMVALAPMERAAVPALRPDRTRLRRVASTRHSDRVSSPGSCTFGPRTP